MRSISMIGAALVAALGAAHAAGQGSDPNLGRNLAATCANCHGSQGNARGDMKPLAGLSTDKITAALADYRSGNQPSTIMQQIAKGYTEEQIKLIAGYFAAQQPKK